VSEGGKTPAMSPMNSSTEKKQNSHVVKVDQSEITSEGIRKKDTAKARTNGVFPGKNTWKRQSSQPSRDANGNNISTTSATLTLSESGKTLAMSPMNSSIEKAQVSNVVKVDQSEITSEGIREKDKAKARTNGVFPGKNTWKRQSSQPSRDANGDINTEKKNCIIEDSYSMTHRGLGNSVQKSADSKLVSNKTLLVGGPDGKNIFAKQKYSKWPTAKRKRPDHSSGARRICLPAPPSIPEAGISTNPSEKEKQHKSDGESALETNKSFSNPKHLPSEKTLTDFCYQDTARGGLGRGRGMGRGRQSARGGRGSMGLVRVKPQNASLTPICPTFRRGLPCNNPLCTLRHDVSAEASRPICSFFQRNGMCSKGADCPFRHIKVAWDAEICPMFEKTGYCEDPDCLLRHVSVKKKRVASSTN